MKLTLRTARKLETKISNALKQKTLTDFQVSFDPYEDGTKSANELTNKLAEAHEATAEWVATQFQMLAIRARIRRAIQVANEKAEINVLISDRKEALDKLELIVNTIRTHKAMKSYSSGTVILARLESLKGPKDYLRGDSVDASGLSSTTEAALDEEVTFLKRRVEELDESLLAKNAQTQIELTNEDVSFLRTQRIL